MPRPARAKHASEAAPSDAIVAEVKRHPDQMLYKIAEVVLILRLSRTEVYEQIRAGRLLTVHQGRSTFVTAEDLAAYVKLLKQEAKAA